MFIILLESPSNMHLLCVTSAQLADHLRNRPHEIQLVIQADMEDMMLLNNVDLDMVAQDIINEIIEILYN